MADATANYAYTARFTVVDLDGTLKTGLTAVDFTATLKRRTTGAFSSATETVTVAEVGSGVYSATFTPTGDGYTYWLHIVEGTFTLSQQLLHDFFIVVGSSSVGASSTDSFSSVSDVEGNIGQSFSTSTKPSTQNVTDFLAMRAAEIEALFVQYNYNYTVPSGATPISGDTSAKGTRMNRMARQANILGAASDALFAFEAANRGGESTRAKQKWDEYLAALAPMEKYLAQTQTGVSSRYSPTADYEAIDTVF